MNYLLFRVTFDVGFKKSMKRFLEESSYDVERAGFRPQFVLLFVT